MRALATLALVAAFDFGLVWVFSRSGYWQSDDERAQRRAQRAAWLRSRN